MRDLGFIQIKLNELINSVKALNTSDSSTSFEDLEKIKINTNNLDVLLSSRLKPSDILTGITTVTALTSIINALPSGTNIIGKVSIDQTTQGLTNFVTNNQTQKLGTNITVSNGLISSNTERIILANRIETILGGIETITDISSGNGQRIKTLTFTNNSANVIFLQIYNKSTALVLGDVPMNGLIFRIPSNSTLDKTVADFGEAGILYGSNTRIGISSTFATFTAITPINTSINIITVA